MHINTRRVAGRRPLRFESLDAFRADAERLAAGDAVMLGNWTLGQVFQHLSIAMTGSVDGFAFRMPLPVIWWTRMFVKRKVLTHGIKPGFKFFGWGASVWPGPTSVADGHAALQHAIGRFEREAKTSHHPILGTMSPAEWYQFHLRHAELHLSFVVPRS